VTKIADIYEWVNYSNCNTKLQYALPTLKKMFVEKKPLVYASQKNIRTQNKGVIAAGTGSQMDPHKSVKIKFRERRLRGYYELTSFRTSEPNRRNRSHNQR
jgi:hypothetical protein